MKRFLFLFWLCLPGSAWAAPTFDAQSSATMFDALGFSWPHTIGATCNSNIVVVSVAHYDASSMAISGVTVGGVATTQIGTLVSSGGGGERLTTFRQIAAGTGIKTVAVTFTGSNGFAIGTARSYCNVNQTTPLGTVATNSSDDSFTPTVTVASAAGELVIDSALIISLPTDATVGAGQTEQSNLTDALASLFRLVESDEAGAASVTMSWSLDVNRGYLTIGVPLKEVPAGVPAQRRRAVVVE